MTFLVFLSFKFAVMIFVRCLVSSLAALYLLAYLVSAANQVNYDYVFLAGCQAKSDHLPYLVWLYADLIRSKCGSLKLTRFCE